MPKKTVRLGRYDVERDVLTKWSKRIIMASAVAAAVTGFGFNVEWPFFTRTEGRALAQNFQQFQMTNQQQLNAWQQDRRTSMLRELPVWQYLEQQTCYTALRQPNNQGAQFACNYYREGVKQIKHELGLP